MKKILAGILCLTLILCSVNIALAEQNDEIEIIAIRTISLNKTSLTIMRGASFALIVRPNPIDANEPLYYQSNAPHIASVDEDGIITAHNNGRAVITVYAQSGRRATCAVTVKQVMVTSVLLHRRTAKVEPDKSVQLIPSVRPTNAFDQRIAWRSSNPRVAMVDSNGLVTGMLEGKATITAMAVDGSRRTSSCVVTVSHIKVSTIRLSRTSATIGFTGSLQLNALIAPGDAYNTALKWTSSKPSVALVSADGLVTARKTGAAVITAAATDGSRKKASCRITVKEIRPTSVSINTPLTVNLNQNSTYQLSASALPANTDYPQISWASSNPEVASVDAHGLVTAVSPGFALIKAESVRAKAAKTCVVMVDMPGDIDPRDILYTASSPTLKMATERKNGFFITRLWVANPYAQFSKFASSDYGKVSDSIVNMLNNALTKNQLGKKVAVGANSDVSVLYNSSTANKNWGTTHTCYSKIIHRGVVLRDDPINDASRMLIYGMTNSGELKIYYVGERMTVPEREAIHAQMDRDGIKNTYGAMTALLDDGRMLTGADNVTYVSDNFWNQEMAVRIVLGQVDAHNFIYLTSQRTYRVNELPAIMKDLGCKTAVLLDSGGSTTLFYKGRTDAKWRPITGNGTRTNMWAVAYWTE